MMIESNNKSLTLSDQVFLRIKEDIVTGVMLQGQKMGEAELAKRYDISRGPLREALQRLEAINLVTRTPHAGMRVVILSHDKMREIYQMREAMEGFATRLATKAMTDAEIDNLYHLLDEHETAIKKTNGKVYFQEEGDPDFHYYIFSKCGNHQLIEFLENQLYQLLRMCRYRTSRLPFRPKNALIEHRTIVDAIKNRDEEFAEMLMRRHIQSSWQLVDSMLIDQRQSDIENKTMNG